MFDFPFTIRLYKSASPIWEKQLETVPLATLVGLTNTFQKILKLTISKLY